VVPLRETLLDELSEDGHDVPMSAAWERPPHQRRH
jgi:hypothetical protein